MTNIDTLKSVASMVNKPIDEVVEKYKKFKENYIKDLPQTLSEAEIEELDGNIQSVFGQNERYAFISARASGAVTVNMYVMGITNMKDNVSYRRAEIIKAYKIAPPRILFDGKVNEYHVTKDGVIKVSVDPETKDRVEVAVDKVPINAEMIEDNLFVAPKDSFKKKGEKANWNYGKELPLHDYSRDIFGVAELDEDIRYCRLTVRNNNATDNLPEIGKSYSVRVLDVTKAGEMVEYTFRDSPTSTSWREIEWEFFDGIPMLEGVIDSSIVLDHKEKLENLRVIAEREDALKEDNKKRVASGERPDYSGINYNSCLFVEVHVMEINIEPASSEQTSRLVVSCDYYNTHFNPDEEGVITGWLSDKVNIDFGIYSKVILCCYPRLGKAREHQKLRPLQIDVFGAIAYEEFKTLYKPERISEI